MTRQRWFVVAGLAGVLYMFIPAALVSVDLPEALRLAAGVAPWRWPWVALARLAIQSTVFLLGFWAAGDRVLCLWSSIGRDGGVRFSLPFVLGTAVMGTGLLGFGLVGLLKHSFLLAIYVCLGVHGVARVRALLRRRRGVASRGTSTSPSFLVSRDGLAFVLCLGWVSFFLSADLLAPDGYWDVLISHLGVARRYLEARKAWHAPPFFGQMPILLSFDYLFALDLHSEMLARSLNLALGGVIVATLWKIVRRSEGPHAAWLAAAILLSCPLFDLLAVHAAADVGVAAFGVMGFMALAEGVPRWPRGPSRRGWLVLAGVCAGFAGATKLPGLAIVAVATALAAPLGVASCACVAIPALLVFGPWAVRAWLLTGNPVYPLMAGIFPSPFWPVFNEETYSRDLGRVLHMFGFGEMVSGEGVGHLVDRFRRGITGPLPGVAVLAALTALWWRERVPSVRKLALSCSALLAGVWAFTVPGYRFYLTGYTLLLAIPPFGDHKRPEWRRVGWLIVVVQAVWLPIAIHQTDDPWAAARGEESRAAYYQRLQSNAVLDAVHVLEAHLKTGPRTRVLAVGEVRNYLAPAWSLVASYFEATPLLVWAGESVDGRRLRIKVKQHGIRYLLVNPPELLRRGLWEGLCWTGPVRLESLRPFFQQHAQLAFARGAGWVYEIRDRAGGAQIPECFTLRPDPPVLTALVCASASQACMARRDTAGALRFGWAATAAAPRIGLSWVTLADALFSVTRYEDAIGAYIEGIELGWRTSASYRNLAIALTKANRAGPALNALQYAENLDPESIQIKRDMRAVDQILFGPKPAGEMQTSP